MDQGTLNLHRENGLGKQYPAKRHSRYMVQNNKYNATNKSTGMHQVQNQHLLAQQNTQR